MPRLRVSRGQQFTVPEANNLLAMERDRRLSRTTFGAQTIDQLYPPLITWIKNTTANAVEPFGVLGIDSPIITPDSDATSTATIGFRSQIAFNGVAPSTSTPHYGKFAVLQEPAGPGAIVRGVIGGICHAKLNIADADDVACDIGNGVTQYLSTQAHGSARILWKESGTGTDKWGLIHIGSWANIMLGKTTAGAIAKGASGAVEIWSGVEGSEASTGVSVTAYNRFANVAITKWVMVASLQGRLYLIAAECE